MRRKNTPRKKVKNRKELCIERHEKRLFWPEKYEQSHEILA